jgi:hypothetical protein
LIGREASATLLALHTLSSDAIVATTGGIHYVFEVQIVPRWEVSLAERLITVESISNKWSVTDLDSRPIEIDEFSKKWKVEIDV